MSYSLRLLTLGLLDGIVISIAIIVGYLLRFDFKIQPQYFSLLPYVIVIHIVLVLPIFNLIGIYRRVWQYASVGELISLVKAVTIAEVVFFLIHATIQWKFNLIVPKSIYILSWVLIILGTGGVRFSWRIYRDSYLKIQPHHHKSLIIGAGSAGVMIAKELKHSQFSDLYPVAYIDDDRSKWGLEVMGLPIIGGRDDIPDYVKNKEIENIIVALPSLSKSEIAKVLEICKTTRANIKMLPRLADLASGKVSVNMIREVSVNDLLGRDPVEVDLEEIAIYVTDQVVLVTGAGGSIGSELCRQVLPFNPAKLLLLGHGENSIFDIENELKKNFPEAELVALIADVQDQQRSREIFKAYRPRVVFHAAAHKHVPLMEANPSEAIKNNVIGTKNVAECAHEFGATHFVMISTDKAVNPTSVMGVSKRVAETVVQSLNQVSKTKFVAVRFGNVLGSRGSVIPLFKRQIQEGGPVTVTHPEMVRYFMTIPEAVQLVIQAGAFAKGGEVFILDMGKPVKIVDLARDLIRFSGFVPDEDIEIVFSGIRPGEKLYEEILTDEEGVSATKHDRIFVGKPVAFSLEEVQSMVKNLVSIANQGNVDNTEEIKGFLKQIVPTYQYNPQDTKFKHETIQLDEIQTGRVEVAAGQE